MSSLEGVFDIGARVREPLQQPQARETLLETPRIIGEVLLIRVTGHDEVAGLSIPNNNTVSITKQPKEVPELQPFVDAANHKSLQQPVGRRVAHATA